MTLYYIYIFIGFFLAFSLYHVMLSFNGKEKLSNLSYALLTFSFASLIYFIRILYYHMKIDSFLVLGAFLLSVSLVASSATIFLYSMFDLKRVKSIIFVSIVSLFIFTFINIALYALFDNFFFIRFQIIASIIYTVFCIVLVTIEIINKKQYKEIQQKFIIIGFLAICISSLSLSASFFFQYKLPFAVVYFGFIFMFILFAFAITKRFNQNYNELVNLKILLEEKVKKRTEELLIANEKIKEMSKQKSDFFINVAHEIKTPLTLIKNYCDRYIKKVGETEELRIIKSNLDKLQRDMTNFLDMEKIEKGQIFYDHDQTFCLSDLISEKVTLFKEIAEIKNIRIWSKIEKEVYIQADPYAIDRVINNFFDNAIKYNNPGGEVNVELQTSDENIELLIRDTGIGISGERKNLIFLPYAQVSNLKRNIDGIGMGLYIVKKIIDSLSGTIEIQSEPGKGTAFKIVLKKYDKKEEEYIKPVKASKPIRLLNQTESVEDSGYDETKDTVLIAEDNIDFLAFLKTELAESYNILVATNGSEALDKVRNIKKPDLIISDIMMGGMDGNLLLEEIKNDEDLNDIPFIFMTAKTALKEKIDGINRGAVAYITKPFDIKELKAQIHSILENRERQIEKMKSSVIEALSGKKSVEPNDHINSNIDLNCIDYAISDKEKDIVLLIIEGLQNKEIAKRLKLSENYVGKKISEIFAKTNSSNRVELANKIKKNPNSI